MTTSDAGLLDQAGAALAVTLPVFGLIGLGWWLRRRGRFGDEARAFVTGFVYWLSLPVLIFLGIARQRFADLISWPIIAGTLGGILGVVVVMTVLGVVLRVPPRYRAALIAGSFWANVTYLGFPLADGAWPDSGLGYAGIVNAFGMPSFVILGTVLLVLGQRWGGGTADAAAPDGNDTRLSVARQLRVAICNPIVLAAFGGLLAAGVIDLAGLRPVADPDAAGATPLPAAVTVLLSIVLRFAELLGSVGLPMALLSVGAALDLRQLRGDLWPLAVGSLGKLVIAPALALLIVDGFFTSAQPAERGVAVLLMGTPTAVGCFVIAAQLRLAEHFVSALLVLSTLLAVVSLSVWLVLLL